MLRTVLFVLPLLAAAGTLSIPADSSRWDLQGRAKQAEYLGRKCLFLVGAEAGLKDFEMRDGVVDVDVATPAARGFFGFHFRISKDGANRRFIHDDGDAVFKHL